MPLNYYTDADAPAHTGLNSLLTYLYAIDYLPIFLDFIVIIHRRHSGKNPMPPSRSHCGAVPLGATVVSYFDYLLQT